ncbi:MAG: hypothetical protein V3W41_15105 [Planctomycetota bacterium]
MFAYRSITCLTLLLLVLVRTELVAQADILGPSQNLAFPSSNNLVGGDDALAIAPDGSWMIAIATNSSNADVIITEFDACGVAGVPQPLLFPSNVNVSSGNLGATMAEDSSFAALIGNGGLGDLVIVRPNFLGVFEAILVDYPGGSVPSLNTRAVIPPHSEYVCTIGNGGSNDLVITPTPRDMNGVRTPGAPIGLSFPASNGVAAFNGVRPALTFDGRSIAVPGSITAGDLVVTSVPPTLAPASFVSTNVPYPSNGFIPSPGAPVLASPDGSYFATYGTQTAGDIVITPLDFDGCPFAAEARLFPNNNNVFDTSTAIAVTCDGRLLATRGTQTTGDIVVLPIALNGVPGNAVNVAYPSNNFIPADAPLVVAAPRGTYFATAGSGSVGDVVVTEVDYDFFTNSVTATARNALFPGNINRRANARFVVAPDSSALVTYGASSNTADLVVIPVDDSGVVASPFSLFFQNNVNVAASSNAPSFDPGSDWVVCPTSTISSDLALVSFARDFSGFVGIRDVELTQFAASNHVAALDNAIAIAGSGQLIVARGSNSNIGDLVSTPLDDARCFALATPRDGNILPLRFRSPLDAGLDYLAALSFGRFAGVGLNGNLDHILELVIDELLLASLDPMAPGLLGFRGTLDGDGNGQGFIFFPPAPFLRGLTIYTSFITLDPLDADGISRVARTRSLTLK